MDEGEFLERCIRGEGAAWDALVRDHATLLYAVVGRVLPAGAPTDVEDVLQAVFLRLWEDGRRRLRAFRGGCRLSTWLATVARREALDVLRRRRRHDDHARAAAGSAAARLAGAGEEGYGGGVPDVLQAAEDQARFADAVRGLPPRDRLLVRLVYQDGCSYREAARLLHAPENSIGPWLRRAQTRLKALLAPRPSP